ncbi:MAG: hypothetical protein V7704_05915 [Aurantimonas endophytica]|uniref:hypothetical protein n=1 Tax=Aurantimonas endophytica TaxID=1522175 RepID=UPI003001B9BB
MRQMIARDALAGLEAGVITENEALEQTGSRDVIGIYERAFAGLLRARGDGRLARPDSQIAGALESDWMSTSAT